MTQPVVPSQSPPSHTWHDSSPWVVLIDAGEEPHQIDRDVCVSPRAYKEALSRCVPTTLKANAGGRLPRGWPENGAGGRAAAGCASLPRCGPVRPTVPGTTAVRASPEGAAMDAGPTAKPSGEGPVPWLTDRKVGGRVTSCNLPPTVGRSTVTETGGAGQGGASAPRPPTTSAPRSTVLGT